MPRVEDVPTCHLKPAIVGLFAQAGIAENTPAFPLIWMVAAMVLPFVVFVVRPAPV